MRWYSAYGLTIQSALSLPELTPGAGAQSGSGDEVFVRFGPVDPIPSELNPDGFGFWSTDHEACHFLEKVGAFLVRGGREIVIDRAPGVEDRVLRLSLLGPVLALVLHQRGFLVMHASVVARDDDAVAFIGKNGWGKSTIAAALYTKGYDLVTDDVAAITIAQEGASIVPGFPQVKLWPEAATLLGETPERLPLLHPGFDKRAWRTGRGFAAAPRRLRRIYALAAGPEQPAEPVPPREACFELLGHWYGHRFGRGLWQGAAAALRLRQCAAVADRVPMQRLYRSGGPTTLLRLAEVVDAELRADAGPSRPMTSNAR